ncbi:hypothetical protein, secreted [gut metagenome]|uniref:Outer membrane protein n=1 Tax=gut metagenome TaxID=749906 RepID=J9GUE4_9ZZZZ
MIKYRQTLLLLLLICICDVANAQSSSASSNNTNSPYTRYGLGQLADLGSGNSKAMGGVAYGLRDKYQVNFANPASYSAVDSLTFIFDGGVSLQNTNFSNGTLKLNAKNSSFDYITMQFRAAKWAGISMGLLPFSNVGYSMTESRPVQGSTDQSMQVTYNGDGGLHQLYLGAGFKIFKNLSVGANISYLWGDVTHTRLEQFPTDASQFSYKNEFNASITSYKLDFGAQYTHQFDKKHAMTVGVVFSPGHKMSTNATVTTTTSVVAERDSVADCGIPTTLGAGFTYVYDGRLIIGTDVMFQNWSSAKYMNKKDMLCDRTRVSVGAEFFPNPMSRNYLAHIKYRLGAYYCSPYYKVAGSRAANEYGVTAGLGLPIPRTHSLVSLSAQYVRTDGKNAQFLNENTFRVCIGITFNERWFFKRKVD